MWGIYILHSVLRVTRSRRRARETNKNNIKGRVAFLSSALPAAAAAVLQGARLFKTMIP